GSSVWGLFMGFFTAATQTLKEGQHLMLQVNYPHEVFLFVKSILQVVNFFIALVMNIAVLIFFGVVPTPAVILFPLVALPLFFLGAGLGLIVSMISVVAFDMEKAVATFMALLIWSVPVIYSGKVENPFLQTLIQWNPLTYLVCSARDIILLGRLYHPAEYGVSAVLAVAVFFVSLRLFYVSESELVERMHT
ncbi:MAG: ABC transporter permease, partial [Candidatus Omnitrophota bacterium]